MSDYLNENLSIEQRIQDLLQQLTLQEKILFLSSHQLPIERLHIPEFFIGQEIARGLVNRESERPSTVFPQPIGMAASFDKDMMREIGRTAGREARAYYNASDKKSMLMLFGPTVDVCRDPRWGRTEECYGEDPFLSGEMASSYTLGLKGDDPEIWAKLPLLKHFCANNHEQNRECDNANLNPRLKQEYYYQAFKKPFLHGRAFGIMTGYHEICHAPAVMNQDIKHILKKEWGVNLVISDAGDFPQNLTEHRCFSSHAKSLQACLYAGTDCMLDNQECVQHAAEKAVSEGLLSEADIDSAVREVLKAHFMLGRFDKSTCYDNFSVPDDVNTDWDQALNLRAARENMILLENKDNTLPLNPEKYQIVGLFGANADVNHKDWYTGISKYDISVKKALEERGYHVIYDPGWEIIKLIAPNQKFIRIGGDHFLYADAEEENASEFYYCQYDDDGNWVNFQEVHSGRFLCLEDEKVKLGKTEIYGWFTPETFVVKNYADHDLTYTISDYLHGSQLCLNEKNQVVCREKNRIDKNVLFFDFVYTQKECSLYRLMTLAEKCDLLIFCGGNHPMQVARECFDRKTLQLPAIQQEQLDFLQKFSMGHKIPFVPVLISSYPYIVNPEKLSVLLYTSHAGSELGHAVVETIFGENNPAGRCPLTWYAHDEDLPDMKNYDIMQTKTTYQYFDAEPLYPFGYGLSYSHFMYQNYHAECVENGVHVTCEIQNDSEADGAEVVQVYYHARSERIQRPLKKLCAFARMFMKAGETAVFDTVIPWEEFQIYDVSREKFCLESGEYEIMTGSSSAEIHASAILYLKGEDIPPRDFSSPVRAELYDNQHHTEIFTDPLTGETYVRGMQWHNALIFQNCNLEDCKKLIISASAPVNPAEIWIHLDHQHEPIGKITLSVSDGFTDFQKYEMPLSENGCHTIRVTFSEYTCISFLQTEK